MTKIPQFSTNHLISLKLVLIKALSLFLGSWVKGLRFAVAHLQDRSLNLDAMPYDLIWLLYRAAELICLHYPIQISRQNNSRTFYKIMPVQAIDPRRAAQHRDN